MAKLVAGESVEAALATLRGDMQRLGPLTDWGVSEVWRRDGWYIVSTVLRVCVAGRPPVRIAFAPRFGCHDHGTEFRLTAMKILDEAPPLLPF